MKDILDDLSDVIDSPDNPDFLYQNDSLQHERSRLRTVFVDVKRQLTLESRKLDEYEQINKSKFSTFQSYWMFIVTLGTNDELDGIKVALEAAHATFEDQNELKNELALANENIKKLENSTNDSSLLDEIRAELKTAKVQS